MFTKENSEIGKHIDYLISQQYDSRREFGRQYLIARGNTDPSIEEVNRMSNRLAQIVYGKKAIQIYDLPYFAAMLNVSCEHILSAGEYRAPVSGRETNYSIANSSDCEAWEKYIHRKDKLILNSDEYGKTVLDYALDAGNYAFIKFLMDKGYIWFDSRNDQDYLQTFGAGTSIQGRRWEDMDHGLENQIKTEDALRINLIALAADQDDVAMLEKLRARENPQLYYRAHYISGNHPDFDSCYSESMVKHIANSSDQVLDYFTDPFEIRDQMRYKDGIERSHRFMFPYISKLLDFLVSANSKFAETAIKKAIRHNKNTYDKLCCLIRSVKNDPRYAQEYMKPLCIRSCENDLDFFENGNIVMFRAIYTSMTADHCVDGIITNVPHITKTPSSPILKQLAEELNEGHTKIKTIKEHIEEI